MTRPLFKVGSAASSAVSESLIKARVTGRSDRFELRPEDAKTLLGALGKYLTEFRREVAGTENPEFRHTLPREQDRLERILEELRRQGALTRRRIGEIGEEPSADRVTQAGYRLRLAR